MTFAELAKKIKSIYKQVFDNLKYKNYSLIFNINICIERNKYLYYEYNTIISTDHFNQYVKNQKPAR